MRLKDNFGTIALDLAKKNFSHLVCRRIDSYISHQTNFTLHMACSQDRIEMARKLINEGADVNERDILGNRPIHYACSKSSLKLINLLIENGADINCCNLNGFSPIYEACTSIYERLHVVKRLLELNPALNIFDKEKNYLIHISIIRRRFDVAELLVEKFEDVNLLNHFNESPFNESPLHLAADFAPISLINKLIEKGAELNLKTLKNALHYIVHYMLILVKSLNCSFPKAPMQTLLTRRMKVPFS